MTRVLLLLLAVAAAALGALSPSPSSALLRRPDPLALVDRAPRPHHERRRRPDPRLGAARREALGRDQSPRLGNPEDPWRLPGNVVPVSYSLTIKPMLYESFLFHGSVIIVINVLEDCPLLVLHAKDLHIQIDSVFLYLHDYPINVYAESEDIVEDWDHEMIGIDFGMNLTAGQRYYVHFKGFDGLLNDEEVGFYRSKCSHNGAVKWMATTQFESTGARMAFPCFDEPSYKARFDITILHDPEYTAVANMPVMSSDYNVTNAGLTTDVFETSPPMSTYLVAFTVSNFEYIANPRTIFKTWSQRGLLEGGLFAEDVGPEALALEANWTGIPFMLPKVDMFAIEDYAAGAMENWGLITFKEAYLLVTKTSTTYYVEKIATVICHELGHMWTGDLVTLDWWSHTWLNEGFATYFENYICAMIKPEWNLVDKYVPLNNLVGMETDAVDSQHAMSSPVYTPEQAEDIFDYIEYEKAGAVLRMFETILTTPVFRAGVHRYLVVNSYKNTNPGELFRAWDAEAQKAGMSFDNVSFIDIASSWTEQPGVPVIHVTRTSSGVTFSQERFFYSDPSSSSLKNQRWWVPLTWFTKSTANWTDLTPRNWITPDQDSLSVSSSQNTEEWLLLNPSASAYYRVNYDEDNWALLSDALSANLSDFSTASRCQLLDDAFAMARADILPYSKALSLSTFLAQETQVAAWQTAVSSLTFLKKRLASTDAFDSFNSYVRDLTATQFESLGLEVLSGDTHEERLRRYYVAPWACDAGLSSCLSQAVTLLNKWLEDSVYPLHPDVVSPTLCYGVRAGGSTAFARMKAKWLAETDDSLRYTYLSALACSSNQTQLTSLLSESLSGSLSGSNSSDTADIFNAYLNRPENHELLVSFVEKYFEEIDSYFNDNSNTSITILETLIADIHTRSEFIEMRVWIEENLKNSTDYDALQKALISADEDLAWFDKFYDEAADWLSTNYNGESTTESSVTSTTEASSSTALAASSSIAALVLVLATRQW